MITHPDTPCWASKLTMLFSFEWWVPCLWQQLFLLAPKFAQQCNVIYTHCNKTWTHLLYFHFTKFVITLQQDNGHISIHPFHKIVIIVEMMRR
jgi:hypothetical protein